MSEVTRSVKSNLNAGNSASGLVYRGKNKSFPGSQCVYPKYRK